MRREGGKEIEAQNFLIRYLSKGVYLKKQSLS